MWWVVGKSFCVFTSKIPNFLHVVVLWGARMQKSEVGKVAQNTASDFNHSNKPAIPQWHWDYAWSPLMIKQTNVKQLSRYDNRCLNILLYVGLLILPEEVLLLLQPSPQQIQPLLSQWAPTELSNSWHEKVHRSCLHTNASRSQLGYANYCDNPTDVTRKELSG